MIIDQLIICRLLQPRDDSVRKIGLLITRKSFLLLFRSVTFYKTHSCQGALALCDAVFGKYGPAVLVLMSLDL